jgi:hypothetical protein
MGVPLVDALAANQVPSLGDYIAAASEYVRTASNLTQNQKKAAQIRLSAALSLALAGEFRARLPTMRGLRTGELPVAGALRTANVDLCEFHELDGLRLAVELKPVNLAVGRALWNRFGDIRTVAVNLHLKFPFAVIGGVLAIPTYEEGGPGGNAARRPTTHLIQRAIDRLARAGGRLREADAAHLLEGVAVVVYDPDTATLEPTLPAAGSGLRWDEFIEAMVAAYQARFGD